MNFLKKLAEVVLKVAQVATGFVPLVQGVIPQRGADVVKEVSDDLTKVAGIVSSIEVAAQALSAPLSGPDKLKMAAPLVGQVVLQSDLLVGHKIKDEALFQQSVADLASAVVGILNSLEG